MRSAIVIVAAGFVLGALPLAALDGTLPKTTIFYNGEAVRAAIADGMSHAGGALASAGSEEADSRR